MLQPLLTAGLSEEVREVVDAGHRPAVPKEGIGQTVGGCVHVERAVVLTDLFLPEYPRDEQPAAAGEESVDIVVVADPRQRVALVGKTDAAGDLRQVDRVSVPIRKLELGFEHEFAIGTPLDANGRAELVAQPPLEVVRIDGH